MATANPALTQPNPLTADGAPTTDCRELPVRNFLTMPLPAGGDRIQTALQTAYPGSSLDIDSGVFRAPDGIGLAYAPARDVAPSARLDDATIGDQFHYPYPLAFDLAPRETAFVDPGRPRNEAFFRALYFDDAAAARASLTTVRHLGAAFQVTQKHCVDRQLAAAFAEIGEGMITASPEQPETPAAIYFQATGGSFNWRVIAGTERLSAHSFGAAIDLNTELGGYWRWAGRPEGNVGTYQNRYPAALVQSMERYGFIWGGKWHHFDGMHFEYRPELILYARLMGDLSPE